MRRGGGFPGHAFTVTRADKFSARRPCATTRPKQTRGPSADVVGASASPGRFSSRAIDHKVDHDFFYGDGPGIDRSRCRD